MFKAKVLILLLLFHAQVFSAPTSNEVAIKQFLTNTPSITSFVFELRRNTGYPATTSAKFKTNNYLARLKPEGTYLRGVSDFIEMQRPPGAGWPERVILVSSTNVSWTLSRGLVFEFKGQSLDEVWAREKTVLPTEKEAFRNLQASLNLGVKEVPIGGIVLHDNGFTHTNYTGIKVSGELIVTNGIVTGMDLVNEYQGGRYQFKLVFEYGGQGVPAFLPSTLTM